MPIMFLLTVTTGTVAVTTLFINLATRLLMRVIMAFFPEFSVVTVMAVIEK